MVQAGRAAGPADAAGPAVPTGGTMAARATSSAVGADTGSEHNATFATVSARASRASLRLVSRHGSVAGGDGSAGDEEPAAGPEAALTACSGRARGSCDTDVATATTMTAGATRATGDAGASRTAA